MAIDASLPVSREIVLASAVPQASLTRRDREMQVEEGQPPMEVAEAGLEALHWRKSEDLREKWKKRREGRRARRKAPLADGMETKQEEDEETGAEASPPEQLSRESSEEELTGTLFDDRS